jgi:hypothetical protein
MVVTMQKPVRYQRIVFEPGGIKVVPIGSTGRVSCINLPDSLQELRDAIAAGCSNEPGEPFARGTGDDYILNEPCEVRYATSTRGSSPT